MLESKLRQVMYLSAKIHFIWLQKGKFFYNLSSYPTFFLSFFYCTNKGSTEVNLRENHYQNEITKKIVVYSVIVLVNTFSLESEIQKWINCYNRYISWLYLQNMLIWIYVDMAHENELVQNTNGWGQAFMRYMKPFF